MKANVKSTILIILILALMSPLSWAVPRKSTTPPDTTDYSKISEILDFTLPEKDGFKLGYKHEDSVRWVNIYYPKGQSSYNWQEMVWHEYVDTEIGMVNLPGTARQRYVNARKSCPDATWDILSKSNKEAEFPYIIFEIKCPDYVMKEELPDIQIWKVMAGKTGVFVAEWSYRGNEIPSDRKEQIIEYLEDITIVQVPKEEN